MTSRRQFLTGLAGILAASQAPAIITPGVLMPVRKIWTPADAFTDYMPLSDATLSSEYFIGMSSGIFHFGGNVTVEELYRQAKQMEAKGWIKPGTWKVGSYPIEQVEDVRVPWVTAST